MRRNIHVFPSRKMNVFLCEATLKPLDLELIQSPAAVAKPNPIEGPATRSLCGDNYIFSEEQIVNCQSDHTLTYEMSICHQTGMELKDVTWGVSSESENTPKAAASTSNASNPVSQSEAWEEVSEDQEMPEVHISSMEFLTEPEGQRFLSLYSIGNLLGTGGCGSVYEGFCKSNGQQVAIKYIPEKDLYPHINLPGETGKLHMEVALMKIVSKPPLCKNVLQLLDWFEMSNCLLLVLERPIPCMDVYYLCISKDGVLDELLAKIVMLQVVEAAQHCYKRGVFHSDIKMENLLFNPDTLDVKLIDFGCGDLWQDTPYMEYGGTPDFCPPEWLLQQHYYAYPATVWSLGILLYNLVCGDMPFTNEKEIVDGTLNFRPGLSKACRHLMKWCLKQNPTKRPSFKQFSRHRWFTEGLYPTGMQLQEKMGGVRSKADDTLMPGTSTFYVSALEHQPKVGDRQCSYMAAQRSLDPFTKHADTQQILKTLKEHFALC